ncbi:DUF3048 domain-containing protein [Aquihabitans sp. G128]|uniref:DUF3048 domain-containing protein n=1 Tax=Aquihabitans sp. G128 TaxID=2849779 RepID=UPI001C23D125|nr:DUF3048 domain-containing protein [Aquihabitans sp. G128]QXC61826.1 DUF3048 domain-containing protein [Aquihabitans sp. G128]
MDEPETPAAASRLTPQVKRGLLAGGVVVAVIALVAGVALSGGDDKDDEKAVPRSTTTTTAKPAAVTTTTQPASGPVAPLTGLRLTDLATATRPALAVKIDNLDARSETAVPQRGLPKADIVIEEIVEGNITRLVAIFQSQSPGQVGPVRSARTTDIHLLPQLGRVLLAWSGGNGGVTAAVKASPAIIDVGANAAGGSYARDRSRKAPHNLYVQANDLWNRAPADTPAPGPLFSYRPDGGAMPASAKPAQGVDLTWGGGGASSPVGWRWDPKLKLFLRSQNGRPHLDQDGTRLSAQNVVVLVTPYGQSPADTRSPEALTVGGGEAFVFTNGAVVHGRWDRPAEDKPAALIDDAGAPIQLTPGQTWIELPRAGGATTVS